MVPFFVDLGLAQHQAGPSGLKVGPAGVKEVLALHDGLRQQGLPPTQSLVVQDGARADDGGIPTPTQIDEEGIS